MKLADHGQPLAYEIAFGLAGMSSPDYPFDQLGRLGIELSSKLRALAIMVLLVKADVNRFHHNLIRSGTVRETYLRRCRDEGALEDHHRASARKSALLDTIAAGDWDLARRIVALSRVDLHRGHEYEDDYGYAQVLHRFLQGGQALSEIPALLDRWEAFLGNSADPRLAVCRAIAARDQGAFDDAFDSLIAHREQQIDADKARNRMEDPVVVADRHIYIEGLALLRLAEAGGLSTQPDYRLCPSLARLPMTESFPGNSA